LYSCFGYFLENEKGNNEILKRGGSGTNRGTTKPREQGYHEQDAGEAGGRHGDLDARDERIAANRVIDARDLIVLHRDRAGLGPTHMRAGANPRHQPGDQNERRQSLQDPSASSDKVYGVTVPSGTPTAYCAERLAVMRETHSLATRES